MRTTLTSLFLAALLAQASTGHAQEAQTDAETAEESGEDETLNLNLGEPVGPKVGQTFVKTEEGDWQIRCVKAPEGRPDPCSIYQLLKDGDGNQVAEVNIFRLPEGRRVLGGATVVVPLETLLGQGVTVSVDGANERRYPFDFCNAGGCIAKIGFTPDEVGQFKRGNEGNVRVVPAAAPEDEVRLVMSLTGFTAAFDSLDPVN
ncbi:invasion associated locus B family protein [Yoonia sediminilitoris]|uniref:Invasion protein IalB n=1 Tax=Yoonia sediminilitoris TaxID=1286148 RepID=A0A2T6K930_9RHOB|nr:invasion associated locus B family protein [Yoonia sediminilitoris]PUB11240.1 invasion protein IalB [Yoonia sediminilitoris]RCW91056.1 invasion protein IalB [Yoonia sediminilitoris]